MSSYGKMLVIYKLNRQKKEDVGPLNSAYENWIGYFRDITEVHDTISCEPQKKIIS